MKIKYFEDTDTALFELAVEIHRLRRWWFTHVYCVKAP